jgi:hypothetical protein
MAELVDHTNQAIHNADCARDLVNTKYWDWAITAAFYSAVHLVEAGFLSFPEIQHTPSHLPGSESPHTYRQNKVKEKFGYACFESYRKLRSASQNVRYLIPPSSEIGIATDYYPQTIAVSFVNRDLNIIKQEIEHITGYHLP